MLSKQIMKNFDLDKIEKKVPYKVPNGFFEQVQEHVLEKTVFASQKETKVYQLFSSKITTIAAAVILLFGMVFFWNRFSISENKVEDSLTHKNNYPTQDLTNDVSYALTHERQDVDQDKQIERPQQKSDVPFVHHDNFLTSLSNEELEALIDNSDQDVYLELYTNN